MEKCRRRLKTPGTACAVWVALCFGVTSLAYLSWLFYLVHAAGSAAADWLSMGTGSLMQAAGMGTVCLWLRRDPEGDHSRRFALAAILFALFAVPAMLPGSTAWLVAFGLLMNLMCGGIAGYCLYAIGRAANASQRCKIFGIGSAVATFAVGLLVLNDYGNLLHDALMLPLYLPLSACMVWMVVRRGWLSAADSSAEPPKVTDAPAALACIVVLLLSAVKSLGFRFSSADIEARLIPELSRFPYALGLAAAGIIADKDRRHGMVCAVAALILPFIMLGLSGQPIPRNICWGLDYLFFGFFSVFRVVLFLDIAASTHRWALAPLGLLIGQLGDVAGTAAGLLLSGHRVALIVITTITFLPTAFLFYRLCRKLYESEIIQ